MFMERPSIQHPEGPRRLEILVVRFLGSCHLSTLVVCSASLEHFERRQPHLSLLQASEILPQRVLEPELDSVTTLSAHCVCVLFRHRHRTFNSAASSTSLLSRVLAVQVVAGRQRDIRRLRALYRRYRWVGSL